MGLGDREDGAEARGREPWERRFRAARVTLPAWAKESPGRSAFVTDASGRPEVFCWDQATGYLRQITDRPHGTRHCAISSSGRWAWWFADTDGDELGVWLRQPFHGGPDEPVVPGLEPAWSAGLALGVREHALLGRSTEEYTSVHLVFPDGGHTVVYRHEEPALAIDLSRDLDLVAVAHSEDDDAEYPGVRILRPDGSTVADLGEPDRAYSALAFAPAAGDPRLLTLRQDGDRWIPVVFDPATGEEAAADPGLPGEIGVQWFQDAKALLVDHSWAGRSELYRYDLRSGTMQRLDTERGTVEHARTRPGGGLWYLWSSSRRAPEFRALDDRLDVPLPQMAAPPSVAAEDLWVDGPGGSVHAFVSVPDAGTAPHAAVFLLHGGPDDQDRDSFDAEAAAWADHGFAVVRVNYRGSSGYGQAWTDALRGRVGATELEDVAAVRDHLAAAGVVDPHRLVLAGWSWGGFLTLLGVGLQPGAWAVGLAGTPVADCAAAYIAEMEGARALDRDLFGGSPEEVPEAYRSASPITYVDAVRAPVFIVAGVNDPRCPIEQVEDYAARLSERDVPHVLHRHGAGHDVADVEERVDLFRRRLAFVREHLPAFGRRPEALLVEER
jgi:dienelactone hydrolase